ncbi:hypothetical protein [Methyloprofundus sp.]|uniref:hypothetical protein n=1 Tax=Methyloprofundus sp. TaxID=2020875 RepID=UPI003D1397F6
MLNLIKKTNRIIPKSLAIICSSWVLCHSAYALEVNSGHFIQTNDPQALEESTTFVVSDFFDDLALSTRLRNDLNSDILLGPGPLDTSTFIYTVHGTDFKNSPMRVPGINSFPSQFEFTEDNVLQNASKGRIGLGGVMRFDLPAKSDGTPQYFMMGDWTLEYDAARTQDYNFSDNVNKPIRPSDYGVSGWFLRNHIDFPTIGYDILNSEIFSNADSFYLSGELGWSPELVSAFFPEQELYRISAKFVLCAQDDNALAEQPAAQIPCVFPNITLNGKTGNTTISAPEQIHIAVDLGVATTGQDIDADYFVAFLYQGTLYWLNQNFQWTTTASAAYQGSLIDLRNIALPSPLQAINNLPSGSMIEVYFGVDATQNGNFDEPYRFAHSTLIVD